MGILLYGLLNGPLYLMQVEVFPPKGDENFQALSFEDLSIVDKTFMSFKQTHINYWLLNQKIGQTSTFSGLMIIIITKQAFIFQYNVLLLS